MKHYCGMSVEVGHGSSVDCGVHFYNEIYQCDRCKLKDAKAINEELLTALQAVLDAESTYEWGGYSAEELEAREKARAAIAKATKQT